MTYSTTVAIAGVGNLGRRYLEGILGSKQVSVVHVYDITEEALAACEQVVRRFGVGGDKEPIAEVRLHRVIRTLPKSLDLVIVATSADARPQVVDHLAAQSRVSHWILEKVLAQDESGLNQLIGATSKSSAWVNMPRRMMEWYQRLRGLIRGNGPISMVVSGGDWGLCCNAVHFMDVLTWWSDEMPRDIEIGALDHEWSPAKRMGFWETHGSMSVAYSGGSSLTLTAGYDSTSIEIEVDAGGLSWLIVESEGMARRSDGLDLPGRVDLQSEISAGLVDSILTTGTCSLPTLEESVGTHRVLLRGLGDHWRRFGGDGNRVPIT